MAEIYSTQQVNKNAARKSAPADNNKSRTLTVSMPAAWGASNGDTVGTGQVLPPACRVTGVRISNAAGAASSTVSAGIRKLSDGSQADADALINAQGLTSAAYTAVYSGALLTAGQSAVMPNYETEVFLTFGGANPTANQQFRIEVDYVAP